MARWEDEGRWEHGQGGWRRDDLRSGEGRTYRPGESGGETWHGGGHDRDREEELRGRREDWRAGSRDEERWRSGEDLWRRGDRGRGEEDRWQHAGEEPYRRGGQTWGGYDQWWHRDQGQTWRGDRDDRSSGGMPSEGDDRWRGRTEASTEWGGGYGREREGRRDMGWSRGGGRMTGPRSGLAGNRGAGGWRDEGTGSMGGGTFGRYGGETGGSYTPYEQGGEGRWGGGGEGRWGGGEYEGRWSGRGDDRWNRGEDRWTRGGRDDRGPLDRLGDKFREGIRKMTGKGPKGYRRSDDRIRDDVCEAIARSGLDAGDIEVQVEGAEVTLTGETYSRSEKRALEDVAESVFGVDEVHNHVRVRREGEAGQTGTGQDASTPDVH